MSEGTLRGRLTARKADPFDWYRVRALTHTKRALKGIQIKTHLYSSAKKMSRPWSSSKSAGKDKSGRVIISTDFCLCFSPSFSAEVIFDSQLILRSSEVHKSGQCSKRQLSQIKNNNTLMLFGISPTTFTVNHVSFISV